MKMSFSDGSYLRPSRLVQASAGVPPTDELIRPTGTSSMPDAGRGRRSSRPLKSFPRYRGWLLCTASLTMAKGNPLGAQVSKRGVRRFLRDRDETEHPDGGPVACGPISRSMRGSGKWASCAWIEDLLGDIRAILRRATRARRTACGRGGSGACWPRGHRRTTPPVRRPSACGRGGSRAVELQAVVLREILLHALEGLVGILVVAEGLGLGLNGTCSPRRYEMLARWQRRLE